MARGQWAPPPAEGGGSRDRARGSGERPRGTAACGGRGFKGLGEGKWREANGHRRLRREGVQGIGRGEVARGRGAPPPAEGEGSRDWARGSGERPMGAARRRPKRMKGVMPPPPPPALCSAATQNNALRFVAMATSLWHGGSMWAEYPLLTAPPSPALRELHGKPVLIVELCSGLT